MEIMYKTSRAVSWRSFILRTASMKVIEVLEIGCSCQQKEIKVTKSSVLCSEHE